MNVPDLFHFDEDRDSFETLSQENGFTFWFATTIGKALGYEKRDAILKVVNRAMGACSAIDITIADNFEPLRDNAGKIADYKLSRFGCYMMAMNGDSRKPEVARAQAYFVTMAEAFRQYVIEDPDHVERVAIRHEMIDREKHMNSTAHQHGVENYALFQNAGYLGMYNMNMKQLKKLKGVPESRTPLDFMGKEELAANLFRVTQTELKIRTEDIKGQKPLERAATSVGRTVRQAMLDTSGITPETLPPTEDIKKIRSGLKRSNREYKKLDK